MPAQRSAFYPSSVEETWGPSWAESSLHEEFLRRFDPDDNHPLLVTASLTDKEFRKRARGMRWGRTPYDFPIQKGKPPVPDLYVHPLRTVLLTVNLTQKLIDTYYDDLGDDRAAQDATQALILQTIRKALQDVGGEIENAELFPHSLVIAARSEGLRKETVAETYINRLHTLPFFHSLYAGLPESYHEVPRTHEDRTDTQGRLSLTAPLSPQTTLWVIGTPDSSGAFSYAARALPLIWEPDLSESTLQQFTGSAAPLWESELGIFSTSHAAYRCALRRLKESYGDPELILAAQSSTGQATPRGLFDKATSSFRQLPWVPRKMAVWVSRSLVVPREILTCDGDPLFRIACKDYPELWEKNIHSFVLLVVRYHGSSNYNGHAWKYILWDDQGIERASVQSLRSPTPDLPLERLRPDLFQGA